MGLIKELPLAVSAITAFEVLYGFYMKGEAKKAAIALDCSN